MMCRIIQSGQSRELPCDLQILATPLLCHHTSHFVLPILFSVQNKLLASKCLNSFSVPYDLSLEGSSEPWAVAFLARVQAKWERCKQVWGSLHMEVNGCYPQAIVL
ncbi:hypothetical protein HYC85_011530 [Camellia sinensis]|uniref:Uncharacterized protein n=1 Tax=Camellia sinensis TaxID=4442 RepID=A0A7J7HAI4_CAMSI|nr:hypothetical protein HYC85_011530 [Camellia sinensis]